VFPSMETRSKTRAGLSRVPPESVLEGPEPLPPVDVDEDLGFTVKILRALHRAS